MKESARDDESACSGLGTDGEGGAQRSMWKNQYREKKGKKRVRGRAEKIRLREE